MQVDVKSKCKLFDFEQFKYLDKYFVLDIQSSYLMEIDEAFYDWLLILQQSSDVEEAKEYFSKRYANKYDISLVLSNFNMLIDAKLLNYIGTVPKFQIHKNSIVQSLLLLVSHVCNLSCSYCYAHEGTYNTDDGLMDFITARKAVDFLVKKSGEARDLNISFFGGEPFLNFELIKKTVNYISEEYKNTDKVFHYSITTNGTILSTEQISFLKSNNFLITVTIDGPCTIHDQCRKFKNGQGSFNIVKKNLLLLKNNRCNVVPQTVISPENAGIAFNILKYILELEFNHISFGECLDSSCNLTRRSWSKEENERYFKELEKFAKMVIESVQNSDGHTVFSNQLMRLMLGIDQHDKNVFNCSSSSNSFLAVTPTGDIYPCHMLIGYNDFMLGNVNEHTFKEFSVNPSTETDCHDCWLRYLCAGGCYAVGFLVNGDINKRKVEDMCQRTKYMFKLAAYVYSGLSEEEFKNLVNLWYQCCGF